MSEGIIEKAPVSPETESREDCLISLLRLGEREESVTRHRLSEFMDISPYDLDNILEYLLSEGSITLSGDTVSLTDYGLVHAREVRKRHHVMESFLINVLGMDHASAHAEAHHLEHSMTQESMQKLCQVTGKVHDNDCAACSNPCDTVVTIGTVTPLSEMDLHSSGTIAYLRGSSSDDVRKLISMGFAPGREISMESKVSSNGPRVVSVGGSVIAVDAALSMIVFVNVGA